MFKREMKINFKSFLVWSVVLIGIFLVVFLIYPSILNSDNSKMISDMMDMFPEEVLMAFNMDISSLDSAFGWLKSEGFVFVLLIVGCYASTLGFNILLKEESDKTIEYLNSLPVKRKNIVISKALSGVIYIVLITLFIGIFNFIGLTLSGEFDIKLYFLMSITPLFSSIAIYFCCMFLSTFTRKTKKIVGISLGIVFISYVFQVFSTLSESAQFLKYFSFFTLADIRNVILNVSINPLTIVLSFVISVLFFVLTIVNYNKKEFI